MAKKISAYTRERNAVVAWMQAQKRRGITVDLPIPATEIQLKKHGITGSKITHQVNELKKLRADYKSQPAFLTASPMTQGTVGALQNEQAKQRRRETAKTSKDTANEGYAIYMNIFEDFDEHVHLEVGPRSDRGFWRAESTIETSRLWRDAIIETLDEVIAQNGGGVDGKAAVGMAIYNAGTFRCRDLLNTVFQDSSGDRIESAARDLILILQGSLGLKLTDEQLEQITEETEQYEYNETEYEEVDYEDEF